MASVAVALPAAAPAAPSYVGGRATTCFWYYGPVSGDPGDLNIAYPDGNAYYWTAYFRRPAGSTLKLKGNFQHARYESIVSYNAASNIIDSLADSQIDPDVGSTNPYRAGADRNALNRAYTVSVASEKNVTTAGNPALPYPTQRVYEDDLGARNKLYATNAPNASNETLTNNAPDPATEELQILMVRIYAPDKSHQISNATQMPEPELTLANGTVLSGQSLCDRTDSQSVKFAATHSGALRLSDPNSLLINQAAYDALRYPDQLAVDGCNVLFQTGCPAVPQSSWAGLPVLGKQPVATTPLVARKWSLRSSNPLPNTFPATNPATWRSTYTRRYLMQMYTGNDAPGAETAPDRFTGGVFFPNPHNNYVRAVVNRNFGKVVQASGKMPITNSTYDDVPGVPADTSAIQMRYRSYCMAESIRTTRNMGCLYDEQIPADANHNYTLAISRTEDRPANATKFRGVGWIEWKPTGDGAGYMGDSLVDPDFGWLGIRDMLPKKSYGQAVQDTKTPGDEKTVMGDYLPDLTYRADATAFESAVGCDWAKPGAPHLAGGSGSPNKGAFTLEWSADSKVASMSGTTYTLQHKSASGGWSDVASGLTSPSYTFAAGSPEGEGTWTYRVSAQNGTSSSSSSDESASVKADQGAPGAPTASADRLPEFAGGGGWFKDAVTVSFAANGDPDLDDGSPGSDVDASTLTAPQTLTASGTASGTVADNAGNVSGQGSLGVQVDAQDPALSVSCPSILLLNAGGSATTAASDGQSGLAADPSGATAIDTSTVGPKTVTKTATDNVGHSVTKSCTTNVQYMYGGLQQPVNIDGSSIFKLGSAVPLKLKLTDYNGQPVSNAVVTVKVAKVSGNVEGTELEAVAKGASSTGNTFSQDGSGQYHFNLDSKPLSTGTWHVKITLDDGVTYTTTISLR